jgi:glyceraldehyde 3-phosphate dehydrogenase
MAVRVGINGFGRMGRLALRAAFGNPDFSVVHVNEAKGGPETAAHLLEFDSVHGRWPMAIAAEAEAFTVNGHRIGFTNLMTPAEIAWGEYGVEVVLECSGKFLTPEALAPHFKPGVRKVIVAAPVKQGALNIARSALMSLIPTTTGSATAIGLIYPELQGKLNGIAVRVPLLNASLTDCVFELFRETTSVEVNAFFKDAAEGPLRGILGFEHRPLVSADFLNDPRSSIVDGPSTMVVDGTQIKILAWYDNEWGYVNRLIELTARVAASLPASSEQAGQSQ